MADAGFKAFVVFLGFGALAALSCRSQDLPGTDLNGLPKEKDAGLDGAPPDGSLGVGLPCAKDTVAKDCPWLDHAVCLENFFNGALVYPGGYCSVDGCSYDAECGTGARCVTVWITRYCLKSCKTTEECRKKEGYVCQQVTDLITWDAGVTDPRTYCIPSDMDMPDGSAF